MGDLYSTQLLPTAAVHRSSLTGYLDAIWNSTAEKLTSVASYSFPNLARSLVLGSLKSLTIGQLRIVTPENNVLVFGDVEQDSDSNSLAIPKAELRIKRPSFWTRVLLSESLGFAEAYMYGDVAGALTPQHIQAQSITSSILSMPRLLTAARFLGDLSTTRANISAHYDIDNTMFSAFLSTDMNYSSAIFKDYNEDLVGSNTSRRQLESLEEGQIRKMKNLIYQTRIQSNHRLLEIGELYPDSWGSLAILTVQLTGCTIHTLTLSSEQQSLAEERIKAAGLSDKITVHLMDYRDLKKRKEWKHYFDRFISVEMMEHVGKEFFETYWETVDWALKEDGDVVGCVQVITLPEARVEQYDKEVDFIRKWSTPLPLTYNPLGKY
ncbi:hypothetical protein Clacol_002335 [Clathrus columnatus]|uniref:Uncharacterized protein n=1 Tax=Clathrus columnatus TaxID=1419009 RepID=A0AAV5A3W0_9AGAM|nr:hypothetical protein Clacol_002335 [Clathrus columnatus]